MTIPKSPVQQMSPALRRGGEDEYLSASRKTDAVNLICMINGYNSVALDGFKNQKAIDGAWSHPDVMFVPSPVTPMDMVIAIQNSARKKRVIYCFMIACMCFMFFVVGSFAHRLSAPVFNAEKSVVAQQSLGWKVIQVREDGVLISMPAGVIKQVLVGESLPNGETVLSVVPDKNMVVLTSGILMVVKQVKANAN